MKQILRKSYYVMLAALVVCLVVPGVRAQEMYGITFSKIYENKTFFNDARPLYNHLGLEKTVPADVYGKLVYDEEAMKSAWTAAVGFKAPDVVGKIAVVVPDPRGQGIVDVQLQAVGVLLEGLIGYLEDSLQDPIAA